MRFCLLMLIALAMSAAAAACPPGYVPCGTNNTLCCR